jgi:histone acetyltransferase (RNA polymerase elongator complex component)
LASWYSNYFYKDIFKQLLLEEVMKKQYIIPIFVPHCGCPHDCIFCNQHVITGSSPVENRFFAQETIEAYLGTMPKHTSVRKEIAFYGGSFTGIPRDMQESLLEIALRYKERGDVDGIRLSTRPDYINPEILTFLKKYGVTTIELGVQSLDNDVLVQSRRGHYREDVRLAVEYIRRAEFMLGLQLMVGLPGDTYVKAIDSARTIVKLGPDFVRIYPTLVVEGTELANLYNAGTYHPLTLDEAIHWCAAILIIFEHAHIPVIRIGLQPTEELGPGRGIVAGPFHPAFRELVESRIAYGMMRHLMHQLSIKPKKVTFIIHPRDMSIMQGHKGDNAARLVAEFQLQNVEFKPCDTYERGMISLAQADQQSYSLHITKEILEEL